MLKSNLILSERKALTEVTARNDVVIEKCGAVFIQDVKDYIKEDECQPNNNQYYKKLNTNPAATRNKLVEQTIGRFNELKHLKQKVA